MKTNETYNWEDYVILIAEDIDFSFLYIEAVLRRTRLNIKWVQNSTEVIKILESQNRIDVVLINVNIGDFEFISKIRKTHPKLPLISMCKSPDEGKKALSVGATGCLYKPIGKASLLDALAKILDKQVN